MNKLLLMSGIHHPPGYVTLDANPANGPDILAIIPPVPPELIWPRCLRWYRIEWIHGITSLYPWDAETVLRELHHCLTPDGVLVLEQPDYDLAYKQVEWVFGDPAPCSPLHMNRWAYTRGSLAELVQACGFRRIRVLPAQEHNQFRDFRIEARL